ncbi:MAG: undecaprenyl/decaprenyl-phosphate alpha-N-acetylglucosaminyl 1-phosphate transferase [Acidobacteriia bacterium]|nr:undecaprenyl/decaprenyl-phosphate alpha-N-acetylglucosaminyl 1-phosphate transferase [Terriglobia bacterium]
MATLIWLGLRAFVFSLILTPIIRDIFRVYDIVDHPDSGRKIHPHPIPRVGGIAIAISYVLASFFTPDSQLDGAPLVMRLLPSLSVVFTIGLIDDFVSLKPWQKLAGQTVAAVMAYWAGVRVLTVGGHATGNWSTFLITILWLLACTNAFNLMDGLDGLAAGIGLLSTLTIFIGAAIHHDTALIIATLPLAGCLLAFLCYNFNPATIFLGDCGSLLIGFLLGCYGAIWTRKSLTVLSMMAPLMVLSLPLLDVVLAIFRRFLRSKPIFGADRGHIHHRLIDRGLSPRRVVLVIYGVCGIAAAFALLQSFTSNRYVALVLAVLFVLIIRMGIRYLGYKEFTLAGRVFRIRTFQRVLDAQFAMENFSTALRAADTPEDCWHVIRQHYSVLGFSAVHFQVNGTSYREWPPHVTEPEYWTIRIGFSENGFIELARDFHGDDIHSAIGPLADVLRVALTERLGGKPRVQAAGVS